MTRYPDLCHNTRFVDIDFPDLIEKKCRVVKETPELSHPLTELKTDVGNNVQLKSDQYVQIGCDLRRIPDIEQALSTVVDASQCEFMFVAEVSITYMETEGADSVIKWASTLGHGKKLYTCQIILAYTNLAEFCLLEQIIPDGKDHPFAKTMLSHFEKLKTPLKSVFTYPDLQAQQARFASRGWPEVDVSSLWQIWSSDRWLSADERRRVDAIEPFDEWEEFALFASHYCVVIAKAYPGSVTTAPIPPEIIRGFDTSEIFADCREYSGTRGQRRFGAALKLKNHMGDSFLANTFGLGTNNRLQSYDLYTKPSLSRDIKICHTGPSGRLCHTITDLGDHGSLLAGGRTSPSKALRDCWLFDKSIDNWQPVDDLPTPLYRHAITRLGYTSLALLVGGKCDQVTIFEGCLLYQPSAGWLECEISGPAVYTPIFGGLLVSDPDAGVPIIKDGVTIGYQFNGMLAGGISQRGIVAKQTLEWVLTLPENGKPTISFTTLCPDSPDPETQIDDEFVELVNRFGASSFVSPDDGYIIVVGGIVANGMVTQDLDILVLRAFGQFSHSCDSYTIFSGHSLGLTPRPLLIGVSTEVIDEELVITGGGATCFSMGTFWNPGCYTLPYSPEAWADKMVIEFSSTRALEFSKVIEVMEQTERQKVYHRGNDQAASKIDIPKLQISTSDAFLAVLKAGKPVVIEGSKLGCCTQTWSSDYLVERLGSDRKVRIVPAPNLFEPN